MYNNVTCCVKFFNPNVKKLDPSEKKVNLSNLLTEKTVALCEKGVTSPQNNTINDFFMISAIINQLWIHTYILVTNTSFVSSRFSDNI